MSRVFGPYATTLMRAALLAAVLGVCGSGLLLGAAVWSPYGTREKVQRTQPIQFSHEHHVGGLGLDCRYCHTTVETAASAGYPATETCMNCHAQVWANSPFLEPVRESWRTRTPIAWTRVYDLPDFVFFNHSIHVAKGVGCETCHGRVDKMTAIYQTSSLYMKWCLDCHRAPENHLRPREEVFTMGYVPPEDQRVLGRKLAEEYRVRRDLTECYVCHR